ncbi:MAG: hypothetical protein EBS69_04845 [Verrucomicrobia bacterium]|nr:hypothetical protein [Verrucomicrobiota bacterium]
MLLASTVSGGPVSALCLGVASHLALDAIPHGDAGIGHWIHSSPNHGTKLQRLLPVVFVDQILGAGIFFLLLSSPLLASTGFWTLLAGAFGSLLPDYLTAKVAGDDPSPPRKVSLPRKEGFHHPHRPDLSVHTRASFCRLFLSIFLKNKMLLHFLSHFID